MCVLLGQSYDSLFVSKHYTTFMHIFRHGISSIFSSFALRTISLTAPFKIATSIMEKEYTETAHQFAEWALSEGEKGLTKQFNDEIDWYTVDKTSEAYRLNPHKCRYSNIPCYDDNRIILNEGEDFIHASTITLKGDNQFNMIAAQGPLSNTVDIFWQLIYQERVSVVVQLCNFREGFKSMRCAQYWPSDESEVYGRYTVTVKSNEAIDDSHPSIQLRIFNVKKEGSNDIHTLHHIFISDWSDYGVPDTVDPVVTVVRWLEENIGMDKDHPILVHCLAGIGRTGTLIALMMSLHALRNNDRPQCIPSEFFMNISKELRDQRIGSIQTPHQYIYSITSLLSILSQDGVFTMDDRSKKFRFLSNSHDRLNAPID